MSNVIELKHVSKNFRVLNRREGFVGSIKDLFSRNYRISWTEWRWEVYNNQDDDRNIATYFWNNSHKWL